MQTYRSKDGDMVDAIAWRYYGRTADTVERVLDANQGLAALGPVLPIGTILVLPEVPAAASIAPARLWD